MTRYNITIGISVDARRNVALKEMVEASLIAKDISVDVHSCNTCDDLRKVNPEVIVGHQHEELLNYLNSPGEKLTWLHVMAAGVDVLLKQLSNKACLHQFRVSCNRGTHGRVMQEYVLSMMLYYTKNINLWQERKRHKIWYREPLSMLCNKNVLIFGAGEIGRSIAQVCKFFDMTVEGISKRGINLGSFDEVYPPEDLLSRVPYADYIVVAAPLTAETTRVFNSHIFNALKDDCILINISRGEILDEKELLNALRSGRLKGAALDVFNQEPLPYDSPLWYQSNLLITPHVSGISPTGMEQGVKIFTHNFECWINNDCLPNEVFFERGY